ncbi:hypothetical protein BKA62DRAFT_772118 [Auriculariales sp. MPI-PUGE-AT-0066]|nr:hypothetical protein BKA62DRAFT_772118 [Auriculariales sp. MPI-PUGE-AT-0066]
MSQGQLPPGWSAQWDNENQRYIFIQNETGHTQWEDPNETQGQQMQLPISRSSQTPQPSPQAVGGGGTAPSYSDGAYGQTAPVAPHVPAQQGQQLFTPGLGGDPAPQYYGGSGEQHSNAQPAYNHQPQMQPYPQQTGPAQLANQLGQMSLAGQKPFALHTTNLVASPPNPLDLISPPPEIRLPPGAALTDSPMANADPSYMRCTTTTFPSTHALLNKTKIPLSLVLSPRRTLKSDTNSAEDDPPVPLVADTVIARCRRCRAYINPYVTFHDGGHRWQCCMCNYPSNEVPQLYDWDQARNQPADRWQRAELTHSVVDFLASQEYMVRAPQPLLYVFLIEVSHAAVQNGALATVARALLESLDRIPNTNQRTLVSFIAFDTSLYFFSLAAGSTDPAMLVVGDTDEVFLPKPHRELVFNLHEARAAIDSLLQRLPAMFQENTVIGSALGPALQAGHQLATSTGGKLVALASSMPTVGVGALKNRDDPKLLGTSKESSLLQAGAPFYKSFPIKASRSQVSVDMFLFSSTYTDVASLAMLPHYTAGQTFFYPGFNAARPEDAIKFAHEFSEVLGSELGLEGVLRLRATRGITMTGFHGNFFIQSTDLLALPAVPQDHNYAIELTIEESMTAPTVVFQAAVLHSTCHGERRIRVVTLALPTTANISELYSSVDQQALATFLSMKAVERVGTHSLENARDFVQKSVQDILSAYKANMMSGGAGAAAGLAIPSNMQAFPILALGLLKHVALRQSSQIGPDLRAYALYLLGTLPVQTLIPYLNPTLYSLHNMPEECGNVGDHGIILPPPQPATFERFERHGLYLIEDGQTIFIWVGRDAVPQLIMDVFDLPEYNALRGGKFTLPTLDNAFSQRINAIVAKVRALRRGPYYPSLYVVKEDAEPQLRFWALSALIQDRGDQTPSYQQWLGQLKDKVNGSSY